MELEPSTANQLQLLFRNRALPIADTFRLLEIWLAGSPAIVRRLEEESALLSLLTSYAPALRAAADLAGAFPHLADTERLELAGLPIQLPLGRSKVVQTLEDLPRGSRIVSIALPPLKRSATAT